MSLIGCVLLGREFLPGTRPFRTLVDGLVTRGHQHIAVRRPTPEDAAATVEELLALPVDVIIEHGSAHAARAAADGARGTPVVLWSAQPVATRLVANLDRPGGNVTGITFVPGRVRAVLELLRAVLPSARRVAVLVNLAYPPSAGMLDDALSAAPEIGLELEPYEAASLDHLVDVLGRIANDGSQAIYVQNHPIFNRPDGARLIATFGRRRRLAVFSHYESIVAAGGLLGTPPDFVHWAARAADYADRILRGTPAGDLPFEQSVPQRVIVNLETARSLDVVVPASVTERAELRR